MKLRAILLALATVACATLAPSASANPTSHIVLQTSVVVDSNVVRLGDLFTNAGAYADATVAYAPEPGRRAVFDANWLYRVALAYGLNWRPISLEDQAVVTRDAVAVGREEVEALVRDRMIADGAGPDIQVELSNPMFRLYLADSGDTSIAVESAMYNRQSGTFSAIIAAPASGPATQRQRITGRVYQVREVPVLSRRISPDEVIRKGDIDWVSMRTDRLSRDDIVDADNLIGKSPKRTLMADRPVRSREVQEPILVPKRSLVTILYEVPRMTLTVKGRAMEDGSQGEVIRVANTQSNTVVDAQVVGPHTVVVNPRGGALVN